MHSTALCGGLGEILNFNIFLTPIVVLKQLGVECKLQLIFEFNGN